MSTSPDPDRAERRRRERADRKGQWAKEQEEHAVERDWELDPEWKSYVTHVRTELVPMIEGSSVGVSLVPKNPEDVDVKFAVELGLMVMLDKPIILLVDPTTILPDHLRRVADHIIYGDPVTDPAVRDELIAVATRLGHEHEDQP
jgi:hypothetical protein